MAESTKKSTVYIFKHKIKLEKRLNMVSDNKLFLEGSRFESVAFCVDFVDPVLVWFLSGCSGFLPQSKDMLVRLSGNSKLAKGVNDFLYLFFRPVTTGSLSRVYPAC